jgi:hypothetical protein
METPPEQSPPQDHDAAPRRLRLTPVRSPSRRWSAALAAATLGIGIAVGAAIGPAPSASLAGDVPALAKELPLLLAGIEAKQRAATPTASTATTAQPPTSTPEPTPAPAPTTAAQPAAAATPPAGEEETTTNKASSPSTPAKKLPAVTNVWLIQLSGTSFGAAIAQKAAAPYINGTLIPSATLLSSWSAVDADAFAADATLAEPPVAGATPPLMHSIVQPPCPEGAAGAACAPETPGELTAADEFLKATLASVMATPAYTEHGLIVITFSAVGIATQSELPAGASTSTLAYQPPAGVALLSPFAKAGPSSVAFNPTSPRRSLEKLLH